MGNLKKGAQSGSFHYLKYVALVVVAMLTFGLYFYHRQKSKIADLQQGAAKELSEQLPQKINEITTLFSVSSAGPALIYHYGLAVSGVDKNQFRSTMLKHLTDKVCTVSGMRYGMRKGGTYVYKYFDANNNLIDSIEISKDSCPN